MEISIRVNSENKKIPVLYEAWILEYSTTTSYVHTYMIKHTD